MKMRISVEVAEDGLAEVTHATSEEGGHDAGAAPAAVLAPSSRAATAGATDGGAAGSPSTPPGREADENGAQDGGPAPR